MFPRNFDVIFAPHPGFPIPPHRFPNRCEKSESLGRVNVLENITYMEIGGGLIREDGQFV
jgi:hypothetical protein